MQSAHTSLVARRTPEILVLGSATLATAGQVTIKLGLGHRPGLLTWSPASLHPPFTAGVLLGLLVYAIGTWLWITAVGTHSISYLYPLASLSYVLVALCGWLLLGEAQHTGRWIGIAVMVFGIVLLTASHGAEESQ